jgi:hypothetical protein
MAATHSVLGEKPSYFNLENMIFIQKKISEVLSKEFHQRIVYDPQSIISTMQRIYEERLESVPRMNQRVVMELCREFRNEQIITNKHLMWAESFPFSQTIYDPLGNKGPDLQIIKLSNRLGSSRIGSTKNFVFF